MISHDLSVLAELCDQIAIMYAGKVVEYGAAKEVFRNPKHPYTVRLMNSFPNIYGERTFVHGIPGYPPSLLHPPEGCSFYDRCTVRKEECKAFDMKITETGENHYSACLLV
jgi:peptide/nickel transport system ATP-binding protein